jgi:hypothetical protein
MQGTSVFLTSDAPASTTHFISTFIILYIGYTRTCVIGSIEVMKVCIIQFNLLHPWIHDMGQVKYFPYTILGH